MIKLISILYRKTQRYLNEHLDKFSLTTGQAPFIVCICENEGISQNMLADKLVMDKSTVAKTAAKLEFDGYILKKQNCGDCRSFNLYPTEKAKKIYPEIIKINKGLYAEITKGFTDVEKMVLDILTERTIENITKYFYDDAPCLKKGINSVGGESNE